MYTPETNHASSWNKSCTFYLLEKNCSIETMHLIIYKNKFMHWEPEHNTNSSNKNTYTHPTKICMYFSSTVWFPLN